MVDLLLILVLAASLGLLLASHVSLSVGLGARGPWHRGLVAFLVPPLAPYWGLHTKLRARSLVWVGAFFVHVVCLTLASIGDNGR